MNGQCHQEGNSTAKNGRIFKFAIRCHVVCCFWYEMKTDVHGLYFRFFRINKNFHPS